MAEGSNTKKTLMKIASSFDGLTDAEKESAVAELLESIQKVSTYIEPPLRGSNKNSEFMEFGVRHPRHGAANVKVSNYFISWKKLLLKGRRMPAAYMSQTLTALSLLTFLVSGAMHVFDEHDARILGLMHENGLALPMTTGAFFDRFSEQFPAEINRSLYMSKVVELARLKVIAIDGDKIVLTEQFFDLSKLKD
jgi:hypothetical protein